MILNIKLKEIAYARSGDKGSSANIGVITYNLSGYHFLEKFLTSEKVQAYFLPLKPASTKRYSLPNLLAFNFVLKNVLDGGGSRSLRIDTQGKALGQALLEMNIEITEEDYLQIVNTQK